MTQWKCFVQTHLLFVTIYGLVWSSSMEFFLNVFHWIQRIQWQKKLFTVKGLEPATSCVRDQDATTAPARHMWETGSLNWVQFMLQWLSVSLNSLNSVKVLLHLGKTQVTFKHKRRWCPPMCQWLCDITLSSNDFVKDASAYCPRRMDVAGIKYASNANKCH